jgi:hypothetical protein
LTIIVGQENISCHARPASAYLAIHGDSYAFHRNEEWTGVKYSSQTWIKMGTKTKRTQKAAVRCDQNIDHSMSSST